MSPVGPGVEPLPVRIDLRTPRLNRDGATVEPAELLAAPNREQNHQVVKVIIEVLGDSD